MGVSVVRYGRDRQEASGSAKTRALAAAAALAFGTAAPAAAAEFEIEFPAGEACDGFALRINGSGGEHRPYREFTDKDGNAIRTLDAGKGCDLLYTDVTTGKTFATKGNGAVNRTVVTADGWQTQLTGHNIVILFPTDSPAGPSTTLYVGRVVFTNSADFVTTLQSASGRSIDICSAVS